MLDPCGFCWLSIAFSRDVNIFGGIHTYTHTGVRQDVVSGCVALTTHLWLHLFFLFVFSGEPLPFFQVRGCSRASLPAVTLFFHSFQTFTRHLKKGEEGWHLEKDLCQLGFWCLQFYCVCFWVSDGKKAIKNHSCHRVRDDTRLFGTWHQRS